MAKTTYSREELERQLAESRREFWAADATINNLELRIAEMAAQLANAENKCAALLDELDKWKQESSAWQAVAEKQLALATSAEQKIAELASPAAVSDERAAYELFMEKRFGESVDRRRAKNGDREYMAWDMALGWIIWCHRAAMLKLLCNSEQLDEVGSWNNHLNTPTAKTGNHTEQNLDMVDHFGDATQKDMLHGSEPETDNTNQQFESLSRGDK